MAITHGYSTEAEFRAAIGDDSTLQTSTIEAAIQTASRHVDELCSRRFYADTNATARVYWPDDYYNASVDDFYTTTGLVVKTDTAANGTFSTTLTINTDFIVAPENGIDSAGMTVPYRDLFAVAGLFLPAIYGNMFKSLQVTAKWGWATVPDAVRLATLLLAVANLKAPQSPGGLLIDPVTGVVVRQRADARVLDLLGPFMQGSYITVI